MSEYVQALELQIKDNAQEAASGLTKLADTFRAIKKAIGGGLKLDKAADQITTFNTQISQVATHDNVTRLNNLASALERIVNATKGMSAVRGLTNAVKQAAATSAEFSSTYDTTGRRSYRTGRHSAAYFARAGANTPIGSDFGTSEQMTQTISNVRRLTTSLRQLDHVTRDRKSTIPFLNNVSPSSAETAARAAERVAEATEKVNEHRASIQITTVEPRARTAPTAETVRRLREERIGRVASMGERTRDIDARSTGRMHDLRAELDRYETSTAKAAGAEAVKASEALETAKQNAQSMVQELVNSKSQAKLLKMQIGGAEEKLAKGIASGKMSEDQIARSAMQIQRMKEHLREMNAEGEKSQSWMTRLEMAAREKMKPVVEQFKNIRGALFSANGGLAQFIHGMTRMAKYRIFRALIREISEGFSTGLTNVREYSKAINGLYASDMQNLDNSLLKMKNSLGAAVAPAIQALIPLFQTLSRWVITVSNYINQFFALMNGASTWTRAIDVQADAIEETGKAAGGAAGKVNNLLAAWDELNIIQSQSGGGGGLGGVADETDYTKMFEEVGTFDGTVRGIVEYLKDNLPVVDALIAGIGAKLLGLSFPAAITISGVVFSFEEGKSYGLQQSMFKDALAGALPGMIGTAIGGAAVGWKLSPVGSKVKGTLIGFGVGAAIYLGATLAGWMTGNNEAFGEESFAAELKDHLQTILGVSILGGIIGFNYGGVKGALIGASVGASVGLAISALQWDPNKSAKDTDYNGNAIAKFLRNNVINIFSMSLAGSAIGFQVTKTPQGALFGAAIGFGVSLFVSTMQWTQNQKDAKENELAHARQEFNSKVDAMREEIQGELDEKYFGVGVVLTFEIVDQKYSGLEPAKKKAKEQFQKLLGSWKLTLRAGIETLTDTRKEELAGQVDTLVSDLETYLGEEREVLSLGVTLFDEEMPDVSGDITSLSTGISQQEEAIKKIGKAIGEYLSNGTVEGYTGTAERLMEMLNDMTASMLGAEVSGTMMAEYLNSTNGITGTNGEKLAAYTQAYTRSLALVEPNVRKIVTNEMVAATQLVSSYTKLSGYTDEELSLLGYTRAEVETGLEEYTAKLKDYQENFNKKVSERVRTITQEGRELYEADIAPLLAGVREDMENTDQGENVDYVKEWYDRYGRTTEYGRSLGNGYQFLLNDVNELSRFIRDIISQRSGMSIDAIQAYRNAGGSYTDLMDDTTIELLFDMFQGQTVMDVNENGGIYGKDASEAFLEYMDTYQMGHGFTDRLYQILKTPTTVVPGNVYEGTPQTNYAVPEITIQYTPEELNEILNNSPMGPGGGSGRAPTGMVSARGGVYTSGASYGAYVETNNGIINTGATASVETDRDEEDANMIEQNRLLREQNQLLQRIANKEFRATPSSAWGDFVNKSMRMAEKAFGT